MLISWAVKVAEAPNTDMEFWKSIVPGPYPLQKSLYLKYSNSHPGVFFYPSYTQTENES
ncbi:hypothetical protein HanOQP8_Chr08g0282701 [Helianthus annuus]|nr:hypothetical protein HanHA89_Chr08g0293441 [Helianthus annuus]KAJ0722081.1 hypothetical protein HanOQP8_Chr08g0282701 [Helianthus annuus]